MRGILADINVQGHVDQLFGLILAEPWKLFWDSLQLQYVHFADIGLVAGSPDSLIWEKCQQESLALITNNRNEDRDDSLEAMIRTRNTPTSLPVFTIASVPRMCAGKAYADRVIERLLGYLLDIDTVRGTGRLYLP